MRKRIIVELRSRFREGRTWAAGAALVAAALLAPGWGTGPAHALGGTATASERLATHVVMVLGSRGNLCSGAVIRQDVVLTAAHCVSGARTYAVAYREGGSPVLQPARSVVRHPQFRPGERVSLDLAVLRLATPLPARFRPLPLADDGEALAIGSLVTVAGFGVADDAENGAGHLREAAVTVLPPALPRFLRLSAAGGHFRVCRGDSGGPVLTQDATPAVAGILYGAERTEGRPCGAAAQAVRIAPQRRWIEGVIARWPA